MQIAVSTHIHAYRTLGAELLSDIVRAGFPMVELYCSPPHWPDYADRRRQREMISHCAELGLVINSIHTPFFRTLEDARAGRWYSISTKDKDVRAESVGRIIDVLPIAEHAPITAAVVHVGCPPEKEDGGTWERLYYSLEEILAVARELSIGIALENITNDFSRGHRIAAFLEESKLAGVGCCYDSGHATLYGRTVDEFTEMAPHLLTTHIHDTTEGKDNHQLPFSGDIDWDMLATTIAASDYNGALVIETKDDTNSFEMLRKAAEAGKRLMEKIVRDSEFGVRD